MGLTDLLMYRKKKNQNPNTLKGSIWDFAVEVLVSHV